MFLTKLSSPSKKQTGRPKWPVKTAAVEVFDEHVSWNGFHSRNSRTHCRRKTSGGACGVLRSSLQHSRKTSLYLRPFGIYLKANWYVYTRQKNMVSSQRKKREKAGGKKGVWI